MIQQKLADNLNGFLGRQRLICNFRGNFRYRMSQFLKTVYDIRFADAAITVE